METVIQTIFNNLPVGILVIGGDGTIAQANPAACHILGCPINGFVGNPWGEIFLSQEQNLEFTEVVLEAIQKEMPRIKRTAPYISPDGTKKYLSVISSAQREEGKIKAIVVLIEDLSELHRMHEREKGILEQYRYLAEQRAESLIGFARSVAHQIRNPITAIAGFARLLRRHADDTQLEPLEAITEEAEKLEIIVRAVSEYSTISIHSKTQVNIWTIVDEARRLVEEHPAVDTRQLTWKMECTDLNIMADRELLVQALYEILLNAVEFGGQEPVVTITTGEVNGHVTLTVEDNGPGFLEKDLDMAFDPFHTTKTVGAGMGLPRARRIIEEHQGEIVIDNLTEGGAQVFITLLKSPL